MHEGMAGFRRSWLASGDDDLFVHVEPYQETRYMICHDKVRPIVGIFLKISARQKDLIHVALTDFHNLLENPCVLATRRGLTLVTAAVWSPSSNCEFAKFVLLE